MSHQRIELLAPAKNLACGVSAINHGADAVYIGGPRFGARAAACNSLADIERLVRHAHLFMARVYVTLNTILDDRELDLAVGLCRELHGIGVDALIIQDVGLLEADLPPIALHSSTQMNNRTADKVRFLEQVGFRQVVLARELSLAEIGEIRAATTVPLEFFVHGALCVSYSGQCYLSEVVAGRSANRGECAQFCRHSFTLIDGRGKVVEKDRYLLSLMDLDLSAQLRPLLDAGISSFKIEGRLKDENYVKNVTAYYRQALDAIVEAGSGLERASSGRCRFVFTPDPSKTFSRGRTDYFLVNRRNRPGAIESPKAIGQRLGRVVQAEPRFFVLETGEVVSNGDGLCFFDRERGLVGIKVNRVEGRKIYPKDPVALPIGVTVYRNSDAAFNRLLTKSEECRTITVRLDLEEMTGGLRLLVRDEDGIESATTIEVEKERAKRGGVITALAEKQLRKCGGSGFTVGEVRVALRPELFLPAAVFNDLRRKAFARHLEKRLEQYEVERAEPVPNDFPWPEEEVSYLDNIGNSKAEAFYRRHGVRTIDRQKLRAADRQDCALMTTRYCIRAQLKSCPKMTDSKNRAAGSLTLIDNTGEYQVDFDCARCEMTLRRRKSSP